MSEENQATTQPNSAEQLGEWVRAQFQRANKHLAENGILFDSVITEESRYLAPILALWKIKTTDNKYYWVISGDMPADFMNYDAESTPRAAIRHFSLGWQMRAENIMQQSDIDQTQKDYAELLVKKAEVLYDLQANEALWKNEA